ncbi:MAG: MG2 domain-containing protein [Polyangiaceae bacterium]
MARQSATSGIGRRFLQLVSAAALAFVVGGGCSSTSGTETESGGPGGDKSSNGSIRIDEAALVGTASGGKLSIDIPVEALSSHASGTLNVSLRMVDGSKTLESTKRSYSVSHGTLGHVVASFDVPPTVSQQADWVRSNVRIDDGSAHGLRITTSLLRVVSPYELQLQGPKNVSQNKTVNYRIHAQNPLTQAPIADLPVVLAVAKDQVAVQTLPGTTDALGDAVFSVAVPETGAYTVFATTTNQGTTAKLSGGIDVAEPGRKVLLTSDKPLYQPGQIIHLRALALAPPENKPILGASVTFEVEDGKGNKIMKRDVPGDAWGVAATNFELGRILNMGTFKLRAIVDGTATEKTVEVSRYALPKYKVGLTVDKNWYLPGDTLKGAIDAGYFFGKPVAGADVLIEGITFDIGETVFQKVVGKTDASGKMDFSLALPPSLVGLPLEQGNALVNLRITLTDTAGQEVKKDTPVVVAQSAVNLVLVPEATALVPGLENRLSLFVTDPLGAPIAGAAAEVQAGSKTLNATTDAWGYAEVQWTPGASDGTSIGVKVTPDQGAAVQKTFSFTQQAGSEHVLVRTDKSVYAVGDSVKVQVIASAGEAHAYVDWLNQGQTVDMRTIDLDASGVGSFVMPVDTTLLGLAESKPTWWIPTAASSARATRSSRAPARHERQRAPTNHCMPPARRKPILGARRDRQARGRSARRPDRGRGGVRPHRRSARVAQDLFPARGRVQQAPVRRSTAARLLPDLLFDKTGSSDPAENQGGSGQDAALAAGWRRSRGSPSAVGRTCSPRRPNCSRPTTPPR